MSECDDVEVALAFSRDGYHFDQRSVTEPAFDEFGPAGHDEYAQFGHALIVHEREFFSGVPTANAGVGQIWG